MGKKGKTKKRTKREKQADRSVLIRRINKERKKRGILPYHRNSFEGYTLKDLRSELEKERQ